MNLILTPEEIEALTGYERATKQLQVLQRRSFTRAFINRKGDVVLERTHYEAISAGQAQNAPPAGKKANLSFFRAA